ncbi:uncharacterized protein [Dermacentor albipictus]|uniref:uncharacterized protein n=1 Tax=Dermacentor albipictus TaxID=60249 RepID=UPI0038FD1091
MGLEEAGGLGFPAQQGARHQAPVLVHFDPAKPVVLTVDASPYGVGAILAHRDGDDHERPVPSTSRRLHAAEQRYSHLDKKGVPSCSVSCFHQYLWGRKFEAVMDHKPLLELWGTDNALPVQVVKVVSRGEELVQQAYSHKAADLSLQQGCLQWASRVVIPQSLRSRVLHSLHAGHPGVKNTKMVAQSHVW